MIQNTKMKALVGLLGLVIIVGGLYGVNKFLNKSTLVIEAEPSYTATVYGVGMYPCSSDICRIDLEKGIYDIVLEKEDYKAIEFNVVLGRRDTQVRQFEFELVPVVETLSEDEIAEFFEEEEPEKSIYLDRKEGGKQALYVDDEVVAYFSIPIEEYVLKFLNDGKTVAIIEGGTIYLVDTEVKSRTKLVENSDEIVDVECSYDGKFCLVESDETFLVGSDKDFSNISLKQTVWSENGELFIVDQYKTESGEQDGVYFVQKYNPETDETSNILTTSELQSPPNEIRLGENALYLKNDEGYFAVKF